VCSVGRSWPLPDRGHGVRFAELQRIAAGAVAGLSVGGAGQSDRVPIADPFGPGTGRFGGVPIAGPFGAVGGAAAAADFGGLAVRLSLPLGFTLLQLGKLPPHYAKIADGTGIFDCVQAHLHRARGQMALRHAFVLQK
jgi:hypothetical protein